MTRWSRVTGRASKKENKLKSYFCLDKGQKKVFYLQVKISCSKWHLPSLWHKKLSHSSPQRHLHEESSVQLAGHFFCFISKKHLSNSHRSPVKRVLGHSPEKISYSLRNKNKWKKNFNAYKLYLVQFYRNSLFYYCIRPRYICIHHCYSNNHRK